MKVPFFDYKQLYLKDKKALRRIFNQISSKGAFILQKEVDILKKKISNFIKSKYAISIGNDKDAMQIYSKVYGIGIGDEVILSPRNMIATASVIKFCGDYPDLVDISKPGGLIDPVEIKKG